MRERAAAVGGRLRTGPEAGGGFLVEATLPAKAGELA
jgi:signal transduction histidine kinase